MYLTGTNHRLYIGEEATWAEMPTKTGGVYASVDFSSVFKHPTLFINPGSRPAMQSSILEAESLGFTISAGESKTSVAGGFSFYLPSFKNQTTVGMMILIKHLMGRLDYPTGSTGNLQSYVPEDNKKYECKLTTGDDAIDYFETSGNQEKNSSLTMLSCLNQDKQIYLYRGVKVTGMTISAPDSNSVISVDFTFLAKEVLKCKTNTNSTLTFEDDTSFTGFNPTDIAPSGFIAATTGQIASFYYGAAADDQSTYPSFNDVANTWGVGKPNGADKPFTGFSLSIQKPMDMIPLFGGSKVTYTNGVIDLPTKKDQNIISVPPGMSGSKTVTGSFSVPLQTFDSSIFIGEDNNYLSLFRKIITKEVEPVGNEKLSFKFGDSTTSTFEFEFKNIRFAGVDFTDIGEDVIDIPIEFSALPVANEHTINSLENCQINITI